MSEKWRVAIHREYGTSASYPGPQMRARKLWDALEEELNFEPFIAELQRREMGKWVIVETREIKHG